MDIRAIFRMIDVDKSGNISRTVRIEILQDNDDGNDDAGDYDDDDGDDLISWIQNYFPRKQEWLASFL